MKKIKTTLSVYWYFLYLLVTIFFFFLLLHRNLDKVIFDSQAYPFRMEELSNFGENHNFRIPLDSANHKEKLFIDLYFGASESPNYIQISNIDRSNVVKRINLEPSEHLQKNGDNFNLGHYLKPEGTEYGFLYITTQNHLSAKFLRIDLDTSTIDTLLEREAPEHLAKDGLWDVGFSGITFLPKNDPGQVDFVILVGVGRANYPRSVEGYRFQEDGSVSREFKLNTGSPLRKPNLYDINHDGELEFIFGTNAPSCGRVRNGLDDSHQYVLAMNQKGQIIWKKDFGPGGGSTSIVNHPVSKIAIIAIRTIVAYSEEYNTSYIYVIKKSDGSIISTRKYKGMVLSNVNSASQKDKWFININSDHNNISWIDSTLTLIKPGLNLPFKILPWGFHLELNNEYYFMFHTNHGWSGLLDKDLKLNGLYYGRYSPNNVVNISRNNLFLSRYLPNEIHANFIHTRIKKEPWIKWYIWRNRWILVSFLILNVVFPGISFTIRYVRLRIKSKKDMELMNLKLRRLTERLLQSQERERKEISREIHDNLGQPLAILKWAIHGLKSSEKGKVNQIDDMIKDLHQSIHDISSGIRPSILNKAGLIAALTWLGENFENRSSIKCNVICNTQIEPISDELTTALFRVVQEALTNVVKHAEASEVKITISAHGEAYVLEVEDNGRGIENQNTEGIDCLGILGMNERLHPYRGDVILVNLPESGAMLRVLISVDVLNHKPIEEEDHA